MAKGTLRIQSGTAAKTRQNGDEQTKETNGIESYRRINDVAHVTGGTDGKEDPDAAVINHKDMVSSKDARCVQDAGNTKHATTNGMGGTRDAGINGDRATEDTKDTEDPGITKNARSIGDSTEITAIIKDAIEDTSDGKDARITKDARSIGDSRESTGIIKDARTIEDTSDGKDARITGDDRKDTGIKNVTNTMEDATCIKDAKTTADARNTGDNNEDAEIMKVIRTIEDATCTEDAITTEDASDCKNARTTGDAREDVGTIKDTKYVEDVVRTTEDTKSTGDDRKHNGISELTRTTEDTRRDDREDSEIIKDARVVEDARNTAEARSIQHAGCTCKECSEHKQKLKRSLNIVVFVLCFANFMLNFFHAACFSTTGVIRLELLHKFPGENNILITLVGALKLTMMGISGLVVGPLVDRFGVEKAAPVGVAQIVGGNIITFVATSLPLIIFSYGLLPGIGYNIFAITVAVSAQKHIKPKRVGLVNGFIMAGQGVGIFAWSSLLEYLIRQYGFNGAVLIEGACVLNVLIIIQAIYYADKEASRLKAKLMLAGDFNAVVGEQESGQNGRFEVATPNEPNNNQDDEEARTCVCFKEKILRPFKVISKYPGFLVYCSSLFLIHIGDLSTYYILPSRGREAGATSEQAALMITIVGACNTVGRIFFGWVSDFDHISKHRNYLVGFVAIVTGLTAITCAFFPIYWVSQVYSVVFGTGAGCYMGLLNTMTVLLVPLQHQKIATGFMYGTMGVAWPLGLIFSELLESGLGSTFPVFLMVGICLVLGGLGLCSISRFTSKKQ